MMKEQVGQRSEKDDESKKSASVSEAKNNCFLRKSNAPAHSIEPSVGESYTRQFNFRTRDEIMNESSNDSTLDSSNLVK